MSHHRNFPRREKEGKRKRAISFWHSADPQLRKNHQPQSSDVSIQLLLIKDAKDVIRGKVRRLIAAEVASQANWLAGHISPCDWHTHCHESLNEVQIDKSRKTDQGMSHVDAVAVMQWYLIEKHIETHLAGVWLIFFSILNHEWLAGAKSGSYQVRTSNIRWLHIKFLCASLSAPLYFRWNRGTCRGAVFSLEIVLRCDERAGEPRKVAAYRR